MVGTASRRLATHEPVPVDLFIRYGRWFQDELVPDVEQQRVERLRRSGDGFDMTLGTGEKLRAARAIVASGLTAFAHTPAVFAALTPDGPSTSGPVSHSSQHADLSGLRGSRVVVIGAGQSALETAALLHEAGAQVEVIARRRVVFADRPAVYDGPETFSFASPPSPLGQGWKLVAASRLPGQFRFLPASARFAIVKRVLGPSGGWWLRDRIVGSVPVRYGTIASAGLTHDQVELKVIGQDANPVSVTADHVIAATGYRVDVDKVDFLDPALRAGVDRVVGWPRLGPHFESSAPGLFFAGLSAAGTFGPVQRFVCGTGFAAARISKAVAARTRPPVARPAGTRR